MPKLTGLASLFFAHVSNDKGIEVAIQSGVDILAHTTPEDLWGPTYPQRMVAAHMALTPTLTLWEVEAKKGNASPAELEKYMSRAAEQFVAFFRAGGQVLFGTDVGYIEQFDTSEEFKCVALIGRWRCASVLFGVIEQYFCYQHTSQASTIALAKSVILLA